MVMGRRESKYVLSPQRITKALCEISNIEYSDIMSKSRKAEICEIRQLSMHLSCIMNPHMTLVKIADFFDRNHSTVVHSKIKVNDRKSYDSQYRRVVTSLENKIILEAIIKSLK